MTRRREGNAHGILVGMGRVYRSGRIKFSFIYCRVRTTIELQNKCLYIYIYVKNI